VGKKLHWQLLSVSSKRSKRRVTTRAKTKYSLIRRETPSLLMSIEEGIE
jgi:hypothetical protein